MFLQSVARGASSTRGSVAQRRGRLRPVGRSDGLPVWEMPVVMSGSSSRRGDAGSKKKKKKKGPAVNAAKGRKMAMRTELGASQQALCVLAI